MNYAAPHVWNLVAKVIRERRVHHVRQMNDPTRTVTERAFDEVANETLALVAIVFADRFQQHDIGFDRAKFLSGCDPYA